MVIAKVNEAENFFKHADKDFGATLDFNPESTELMIIDACAQHTKLVGKEAPLFLLYRIWFTANKPEVYILSDELKAALQTNAPAILAMGRKEYARTILPLILEPMK